MLRRFVILLIMMCFARGNFATAQFHTTGADPWSIRFKQIDAQRYRLVFDSCHTAQALRLAQIMDTTTAVCPLSLRHFPRKTSILVHSRAAYSNGLVSWAPRRLEMYSYPPQDGDCQLWFNHLALHEYRHVVQTDKLNTGFTRFLYYLFGEQAVGAVLGVYVPMWFMEGDAVMTETALSRSGRGRKAAFEQEMRALTLQRGAPKYNTAYFGSFRQRLPDYYHMGYLTVGASRLKYGDGLWPEAIENCGRRSWSITPFNNVLRRRTGLRKHNLYAEAMDFWRSRWLAQDSTIVPTPHVPLPATPRTDYAEYTEPHAWRGKIVSYKTGPDFLSAFVAIDSAGAETVLHIPSARNECDFDLRADTLIWCERVGHVRWENASHSPVKMMSLPSGKVRTLCRRGRFASPVIAPDGQRWAAIETDASGRQHVSVFDWKGNRLGDAVFGIAEELSSLRWGAGGLFYVVTTDGGKHIERLSADGVRHRLTSPKFVNIRHLHVAADAVYFTSDSTGIDNIYSVPVVGGAATRITSSRFGAAWPMVSGDTLVYSEYSARGYSIVRTSAGVRPTDSPISPMLAVADTLGAREAALRQNIDPKGEPHTIDDYSRWSVLNVHSWGPAVVSASDVTVRPGVSVASQSLLGTTVVQAGVTFDKADSDEAAFVGISYNALFPKFSLRATWGYEDYSYSALAPAAEGGVSAQYISYDDRQYRTSVRFGVSQPLSFNSGAWLRSVVAQVVAAWRDYSAIEYTSTSYAVGPDGQTIYKIGQTSGTFGDYDYTELNYGLSASVLRRTAERDVGTRLGVSAEWRFSHAPFGADMGNCQAVVATVYLPGVGRHHRMSASLQWQKKRVGESAAGNPFGLSSVRLYGDAINVPRGCNRLTNTQMTTLRTGYMLPVVNPDWSLGGLLHIKRLTAQLFYDRSEGRALVSADYPPSPFEMSSTGIELIADSRWLRLPYKIELGYRLNYVIQPTAEFNGNLLFSISF